MLKEEHRQAYLKAMGIQVYYPRRHLPATKASHPDPQASHQTPGPTPVLPEKAQLKPQQQRPPQLRTQQAEPQRKAQQEESDQALRFHLICYSVNARLLVLCELPHQAPKKLQQDCRQLLQAILRALEVDEADPGAADDFIWPLPDMPSREASADNAARTLAGFITMQRDRRQAQNLLVFSDQVGDLLPGADRAGEAADYHLHADDYYLTRCSSLGSMLAMPAIKKDVWEQLQPLRRRLLRGLEA